ncbi:MAG: thioredoxin family protein [Betaproteobacteria bacterium]|nr:thioredoxin family protein [Betaproteobacteria bacterium]
MPYDATYRADAPERATLDARRGLQLIEFGADWCGHCQAAQPAIRAALATWPDLPHRKIEDGPGRRLGRSYRVKLWPTLILLRDGQEIGRVVRPTAEGEVNELLKASAVG